MKAKEIMRKSVITLDPEMTLREAAQLFLEHRITGAPVVDQDGSLLGVVSQTDLVRRDREAPVSDVPGYHQEPEETRLPSGLHVETPDYARVRDVMTPKVVSFEEDRSVREIARAMLRKRIHRVVITRRGTLCGILTTMDLLSALLRSTDQEPGPAVKGHR